MTVVYIDSVLLINFCINYFLLLTSAKLAGEGLRRFRFMLASLFGAVYAALTFFPAFRIFVHPVFKAGIGILMVLIAFGGIKRLVRMSAIFLALSCAFGGGLLALKLLNGGSYTKNGIIYSAMDMKGILISVAFFYGIISLFFRRAAVHSTAGGELISVKLRLNQKTVQLTALRDSGNTLNDPLTGRPVLVVEGERLQTIFPQFPYLNQEALKNPIETLQKITREDTCIRFRLLPYRAVGVNCGMLLAVRLDCVLVDQQEYQDYLVALSPNPLSDGGGYSALIGCQRS